MFSAVGSADTRYAFPPQRTLLGCQSRLDTRQCVYPKRVSWWTQPRAISPGALTRMTIPLREARGQQVQETDIDAGGPQHVAPVVAWLASEESAGISNQIIHAASGMIGIMQQPRIVKSFRKKSGAWTLEELDDYMPQLIEAKQKNDEAAQKAGEVVEI